MRNKRKGVAPIISAVLIVGILAAMTFFAYQWGMPMIQKNVDISTLNKGEQFLKDLSGKINLVARYGGAEEITFDLPGEIEVNPKTDTITFSLTTRGTIYSAGGFVCFNRNCDREEGTWGEDNPLVRGVQANQPSKEMAINDYKIISRNLTKGSGANKKTYFLNLTTQNNNKLIGSEDSKVYIEKLGETRGEITTTTVQIDIR